MSHRITVTLSDKDYQDLIMASKELNIKKSKIVLRAFELWIFQRYYPLALKILKDIEAQTLAGSMINNKTFYGLDNLIKTHE